MKKIISVFIALTIVLSAMTAGFTVSAKTKKSGKFGECKWSFNSSKGEVILSGKGDTKEEQRNDEKTLFDTIPCSKVKKITIKEGVKSLCYEMFGYCKNLKSVTIPGSMKYIDGRAFAYCSKLSKITFSKKIKSCEIDSDCFTGTAFYKNKKNWKNGALYLGKILVETNSSVPAVFKIKKGTKFIVTGAFAENNKLKSVTMPNTVTNMGSNFMNCENLKSVTLSNKIKSIGDYSFENCIRLKSIKIPKGVKSIEYDVFSNCSKLSKISLPDTITHIGRYSFISTKYAENAANGDSNGVVYIGKYLIAGGGIKECKVKKGTKLIADYAFEDSDCLTSVAIPKSLVTIGESAFVNCKHLKSINISTGVKNIGMSAFGGCTKLKKLTVAKKNKYFVNKKGVLFNKKMTKLIQYLPTNPAGSYTVPDGVKTLCAHSFYGCENLEKVVLPKSITYIGGNTFCYDHSLYDIYYKGSKKQWKKINNLFGVSGEEENYDSDSLALYDDKRKSNYDFFKTVHFNYKKK